ncbi:hypothetical protein DAI18_18135 [Microvirgula aerodenitrificans]|uniref:YdbS-like PH domain-containing protein n=1 Tax=Microvirgula aerodenitrificans TaxID=57480 RepID=A0A2S0PER2_9NEIS|nr:PH domain-containing protein [Microvirgula aerodenitrificans]AVY95747.1 hypothetical protein DAI18_18135 [Microvirgula aerodenitrificans]
MSYIDSNLMPGEQVVYRAKVSWLSQIALIISGVILLFVFFIGIIPLAIAVVRVLTTELAITNKRVIAKFGFISRRTIELKLEKVESVQVDQGIFGRMLGFGTLVIGGAGNPAAPVPSIDNPLAFRRELHQLMESTK